MAGISRKRPNIRNAMPSERVDDNRNHGVISLRLMDGWMYK